MTQANRVTAANEKQRKSYLSLSNQMNGFMRNMAKLVSLKAIAEYLGNAVAKFNDFYEATDLFHNAMGNLSGEADALISKMQGLLGVDPTKAMTYMATIQSLGTSFGLASDKAYVLSKNLTQLAYDEHPTGTKMLQKPLPQCLPQSLVRLSLFAVWAST